MEPLTAYDGGPLRVIIAEGQGLVRAGFRVLLERQEGIVVTAEAATGEDAVAAARATDADVVLVDLDLPTAGGIDAARRIVIHDENRTLHRDHHRKGVRRE